MEKKTMGSFLAALRKANGLTQQQVADKLNVSNKTVSKWERDEGLPEVTMLPAIAEIFSVTVDELLCGEKISKESGNEEKISAKAKEQATYLFYSASKKYSILSILSIIFLVLSVTAYPFMLVPRHLENAVITYYIGVICYTISIVTSIILEVIGLVNFKNVIEQINIAIDEKAIINGKKRIRNYIIIFSLLLLLVSGIIFRLFGIPFVTFLCGYAIIAPLLALILNLCLTKSFLDAQYLLYRKKVIKIVSILSAVYLLISPIIPFIEILVDPTKPAFDIFPVYLLVAIGLSIISIIIGMICCSRKKKKLKNETKKAE